MFTDFVLYIEDHLPSVQLVERFLSIYSCTLLKATTAEEGLALALQYPPRVILMDVDLPGIDGITAIPLFKQYLELRATPIVVVTARDDLRQAWQEAGGAALIRK